MPKADEGHVISSRIWTVSAAQAPREPLNKSDAWRCVRRRAEDDADVTQAMRDIAEERRRRLPARRRPQPEGLTAVACRYRRRSSSTMPPHRLLLAATVSTRNRGQRHGSDLFRGSLAELPARASTEACNLAIKVVDMFFEFDLGRFEEARILHFFRDRTRPKTCSAGTASMLPALYSLYLRSAS